MISPLPIWRWIRSHRKRSVAIAIILLLIALNVVAYVHAHAMTHFIAAGERTAPPEELGAMHKIHVLLTGVRVPRQANRQTPQALGLSFHTARVDLPNGESLETWGIAADQKPSRGLVLLFHAYAASKSSLLSRADVFHEMGFDVTLVDFRGSGGSSGNDTTIGYREADDVAAVVRDAKQKHPDRPLILFGQSMGAAAVLRSVAVSSALADAIIVEATFDRLLSTVESRFRSMGLPTFPFARLLVFWGGIDSGYSAFAHNPVDYAKSITIPTLVLQGRNDMRVKVKEGQAVFDALRGTRQLKIFEHSGHANFLAAERDAWIDEVESFLKHHASAK